MSLKSHKTNKFVLFNKISTNLFVQLKYSPYLCGIKKTIKNNKKNLFKIKIMTTIFFVSNTQILPAIDGKFGLYAKCGTSNFSQKKLEGYGYELMPLTAEEYTAIATAYAAAATSAKAESRQSEMQQRFDTVNTCLNYAPLAITGSTINILGSAFADAYSGCGKGTAYIKDSKLTAFHYGFDAPANAPAGTEIRHVDLSCGVMLF